MIDSLKNILNAHREAFETTRHEAGKVLAFALEQGQKLGSQGRVKADDVVENFAGVADEQLAAFEQAFQKGVSRAIRRIGLPTAQDVNALSRRVDALAAQVKARAAKKAARRPAKRAA